MSTVDVWRPRYIDGYLDRKKNKAIASCYQKSLHVRMCIYTHTRTHVHARTHMRTHAHKHTHTDYLQSSGLEGGGEDLVADDLEEAIE